MNGFGFIEYKDAMDARDVVPAFHGTSFMGERLIVQFARGSRRENHPYQERIPPRPRRTQFRMQITGLPPETSWQDLKDFARQPGLDVVYSEVSRDRDGKGFVEYETAVDLRSAVEKLDNSPFKGQAVHCVADVQDERPRDRYRSRSPGPARRPYPAPQEDYYYQDRRGPPRGYSPRRDDYRRRTPPTREYYESRDRYGRSPPRPRVVDEYGPPRPRYPEDGYDARQPPPRRGYEPDPYVNGHGRPYERVPSPRRPRSPGARGGFDAGYERRGY